ncbi:poly polymerase [Trichonephila clavipes]|nr:poly polymerase [Trichonephila clavipes]
MIPAYNKKRCAAVPFETGIHFRRKTDFFPEEDATKSYSGFESEPTRRSPQGTFDMENSLKHQHSEWFKKVFLNVDSKTAYKFCRIIFDDYHISPAERRLDHSECWGAGRYIEEG